MSNDKLATKNSAALSTNEQVPEYLQKFKGDNRGSEGVEQEDLLVPRLAQAQSENQTKQMDPDAEEYIEGLKAGDFFNSVTGQVYGQRVKVVPITFSKSAIEFKPQSEGGGVRKIYNSDKDVPKEDLQFTDGVDDKGNKVQIAPKATIFKNRMCVIFPEDGGVPELIAVQMKKANLGEAKKWNSLIALAKLPAFAKFYFIDAIKKPSPDGKSKFSAMNVKPGGFVPEDFVKSAEAYFDMLEKNTGIKVDNSGLEPEAENLDSEPALSNNAPAF